MGSNVAASVRQRLLNRTRKTGEEHQVVLTRFALERLLYRLMQLPEGKQFVLKGAFAFLVWEGEEHRMTRDLDLLGHGAPDPERLREVFERACLAEVKEDGVTYDAESIRAKPVREGAEYDGLRVKLNAYIGSARLRLQIDVGFGDAATPAPKRETFPALLDDFPAPVVRTYRPETTLAEKLHGMVKLGLANSRMKDYYDVWHLSQRYEFGGPSLARAIRRTFERRGKALPEELPTGLTDAFAEDAGKQRQWGAFARPAGPRQQQGTELALQEVVETIRRFLAPLLRSLSEGRDEEAAPLGQRWPPGGPWQKIQKQ